MKKHEKLGITAQELIALKGVRDGLKYGLFEHRDAADPEHPTSRIFNMGVWQNKVSEAHDEDGRTWSCGTVGCIGGWMGMLFTPLLFKNQKLAKTLEYEWQYSPPLKALFYPDIQGNLWTFITNEDAVKAINKFLKGDKFPWQFVEDRY